jgi:predicted NACHT family NTPase
LLADFSQKKKEQKDTGGEERARLAKFMEGPLSDGITVHLTKVVNLASETQFFGMSSPLKTDKSTIALDINAQSLRFQCVEDASIMDEKVLLDTTNSILLLGEPGSGKTTTIKRIALDMLREEPSTRGDICQFPIVVRLKDLNKDESLYTRLADEFGLSAIFQLNSLNQAETENFNEGMLLG